MKSFKKLLCSFNSWKRRVIRFFIALNKIGQSNKKNRNNFKFKKKHFLNFISFIFLDLDVCTHTQNQGYISQKTKKIFYLHFQHFCF